MLRCVIRTITVSRSSICLSGKLTRIVVHVDLQPIADELHGDYINDKSFKRHFQQWLNSLWQEKDRLLTSLMSSQRQDK